MHQIHLSTLQFYQQNENVIRNSHQFIKLMLVPAYGDCHTKKAVMALSGFSLVTRTDLGQVSHLT